MLTTEVMRHLKPLLFPVLGTGFQPDDYCPIPLSKGHPNLNNHDVTTYDGLDQYVQAVKKAARAQVAYGGYGERRAIYTDSPHFTNPQNPRCIHLGVDLWAAAGTPVFAPLDGIIHSFKYNNQHLDYGATLITEHEVGGFGFWLLFGHLSLKSIENLEKNAPILRGSKIAELGNRHENGGWSPHLHLQAVLDLQGWTGDFPGVATEKEAIRWLANSPSPMGFVGI